MSHYARLTRIMWCITEQGRTDLPAGLSIKSVRLDQNGVYLFWVNFSGEWVSASTTEDLPAFTDKGTEARAKRRATLRPGKPRMGATAATRRLVCKVREDQHKHVELSAESAGLTVSERVRRALIADGMPE